jgi:hypothetical protein
MIIEMFILFTSLAFILALVGKALNQELLIIFGFLVIGLMAVPLLQGNLDYRSGETLSFVQDNSSLICHNETLNISSGYIYGNYFGNYHWDGYNTTAPIQADKNAYLFHTEEINNYGLVCDYAINEVTTINYTTYTDTIWFGLFFLLICISGLFMWYQGYGYNKKEEDD